MSKIDYQALRGAAEAIKIAATPQKLLAFRMKVTPQVVLALLDERERNQQYIKRRDQENEEIALTVGKLRVELEGKDRRITEVTMWIKRLSSSLKNAKPDSKLPDDAMTWLNNEGLTSIEDILR
ncbi:ead/Ea22-like family protein [Salmonella enterica]|nr:ead/Ea22-like family protein [Salmonella enterica]ELC5242562.1 ead/Ea22-like family protein [Salmonella enterica]